MKEILDIKVKNYSKLLNSQKEYLEKENIKKADLNALELCQNDYDEIKSNILFLAFELSRGLDLLDAFIYIENRFGMKTLDNLLELNYNQNKYLGSKIDSLLVLFKDIYHYTGSFSHPNLSDFINLILQEYKLEKILDLNISLGSYVLERSIKNYDAFSCNKKIVKNLNKLYDKERIKLCPDLNEIKKFDAFFDKQLKKYELIICFPPLVKNYEAYINSAFKLLNDKGKILFLAPISILNNKKFRGYLNEHDSSISGIFELDNKLQTENVMGFTNINVSLIILNKNRTDLIFSSALYTSKPQLNLRIFNNYTNSQEDKYPSNGRMVRLENFRGYKYLEWIENYRKIHKKSNINELKLKELCLEINTSKEIHLRDNSIYFPKWGTTKVKESLGENDRSENYYHLILNNLADASYLCNYFNSKIGAEAREANSSGASINHIDSRSLEEMPILIPAYNRQLETIKLNNGLINQISKIEELQKQLWKPQFHVNPAIAKKIVKIINDKDEGIKNWAYTLPFPISSILWEYISVIDKRKKTDHLLSFFESYCQFKCVIILSALRSDYNFFLENKRHWQNEDPAHKDWIIKSAFGGWVHFYKKLRGFLYNYKKEDGESIFKLFGNANESFIDLITNGTIVDILEKANRYRNDIKGHGGLTGAELENKNLIALENLLSQLRKKIGDAFDDFKIIYPGKGEYANGLFYYSCKELVGKNAPFNEIEVKSSGALEKYQLYFQINNNIEKVRILPFIKYYEDNNALYFYSKLDVGTIRYISHHFAENMPKKEDINTEFQEILDDLRNE